MRSKIIAVDFDGTLCENKWPEIGEPNHEVIDYVKDQQKQGAKIILWTCRSGRPLINAVAWCKGRGIIFDTINDNIPEAINHFGDNPRKVSADEYIDDRACTRFKLPYIKEETRNTQRFSINYDEKFDVLTILFFSSLRSYCSDIDNQAVKIIDVETGVTVGVIISSFMNLYVRDLTKHYERMFGLSFDTDVLPFIRNI